MSPCVHLYPRKDKVQPCNAYRSRVQMKLTFVQWTLLAEYRIERACVQRVTFTIMCFRRFCKGDWTSVLGSPVRVKQWCTTSGPRARSMWPAKYNRKSDYFKAPAMPLNLQCCTSLISQHLQDRYLEGRSKTNLNSAIRSLYAALHKY